MPLGYSLIYRSSPSESLVGTMMKDIIKKILSFLFTDYQFNRIYFIELPILCTPIVDERLVQMNIRSIDSRDQFASADDQRIRDHASYFGKAAFVYGIFEDDVLVCICSFWTTRHPSMPGRFSKLKTNEAVMVDLLTTSGCRGKGYALMITYFAEKDLFNRGYIKLWTWVWHSNISSIRVFDKASWQYSHFLAEFQFKGMKDYFRLRLPTIGR